MKSLHKTHFADTFVSSFPGDHSGSVRPRQTPGMLYSSAPPTSVSSPSLLAWSYELAAVLNLGAPAQKDIDILGGNLITPTMHPYAACYAGHQFGNWAGQLGDGRAITLGEIPVVGGQTYELQLKGAGPTAYSRTADGRAVLRSSVREYLMSEAMHYLGIPTTRALSLVSTGDQVLRDMFYNGNPAYEPGAIVARVSPSFVRFGNFEILADRGEWDHLQQLADYTIKKFYPQIPEADKYLLWFKEIADRTAHMIVEWLRVGFVHGVMNTDNMSILGLTIDYGPYSFLDDYDPKFTPNTTDLPGRRYAFARQGSIAYWNLGCLASAVAPLINNDDRLGEVLSEYESVFLSKYHHMMVGKLGLGELQPGDAELIATLEKMLNTVKPDMTIFYQLLIDFREKGIQPQNSVEHFSPAFYKAPDPGQAKVFVDFIIQYDVRVKSLTPGQTHFIDIMKKVNPRFVLRNYLLHEAIQELENGNSQLFEELQLALKDPYGKQHDKFFKRRPDWATSKAGCSMLSCSS